MRISLLIVVVGLCFWAGSAQAVIRVDVTGGAIAPSPIATPAFAGSNQVTSVGTLQQIGEKIARVISSDLSSTGFFAPIVTSAYPVKVTYDNVTAPDYPAWQQTTAQTLISGFIQPRSDGSLLVGCYVHDIFSKIEIGRQGFTVKHALNWRRVAHKCADFAYSKLTGEGGYFDSRIVYISESGPKTSRIKRLAIMDQDGANVRMLTSGQSLVLTPRFAPNNQIIAYLAYYNDRPRVYLYNLLSGRHQELGRFDNMNFSPRFAPNGNQLILSLIEGGSSNIYIYDLRTRRLRRLTHTSGINTAPCFSPDGSRIVFESDRGGSQQLYVMNSDGSNVQRISYDSAGKGKGRYGTPVWSPRGDVIAFTKISKGKFRIGVMSPDGSGERLLTNSWQDEGPTWSPNGRVIMFFRTRKSTKVGGGDSELWSVDLTGQNERRVSTRADASDPAWSPLLP